MSRVSPWKSVPISEVYEDLFDGPHATPRPSEDGPIFLGINNITDDGRLNLSELRHIAEADFPRWTKRVSPEPEDIVFTYEATLNRYAMIPSGFRGCLGRRLALIRPDKKKVIPRFLFYYFFSEEWRRTIATNTISGATVERIPLVRFPSFPVRIPPVPVQAKTVAILSAYDDLIVNNERRVKVFEDMGRATFKNLFLNHHQSSTAFTLNDLCAEVRDGVLPEDLDEETPCIGLEHFPRRSIILREWGSPADVVSGKLRFQLNDVLFGKIRPNLHKVAVSPVAGVCSSDTIILRPKVASDLPIVLFGSSSDEFVAMAVKTAQGTKMPRANWNVMKTFKFSKPSDAAMMAFNDFCGPIVEMTRILVTRNRLLARMRDLLLPKLISGEIDVSKLDIESEAIRA